MSIHTVKAIIACSAKLHAFNLASQFDSQKALLGFYTGYATQKAPFLTKLFKRHDKEAIHTDLIHVHWLVGMGLKFDNKNAYWYNDQFDAWTAKRLKTHKTANTFIGWSGMSLRSLRAAKQQGLVAVVERGSAHISYQNEVLKTEYARHGLRFQIDQRVIDKELQEYEVADYICVPSLFAKQTYIDQGIDPAKVWHIPLGTDASFMRSTGASSQSKFRIVYLGALMLRKGIAYLFEALRQLDIPDTDFEVVFIGGIDPEVRPLITKYKANNWHFMGHVAYGELPSLLQTMDIGVFPSLEDGFGKVITQMLASGVPTIASTNTAALDVIKDGENGFIIPIQSVEAIKEKIEYLFYDRDRLAAMKRAALSFQDFTWEAFGATYLDLLKQALGR